jgi:hypothetical protein
MAVQICIHFYCTNIEVSYTENPGYHSTVESPKWAERVVILAIWRRKVRLFKCVSTSTVHHWSLIRRIEDYYSVSENTFVKKITWYHCEQNTCIFGMKFINCSAVEMIIFRLIIVCDWDLDTMTTRTCPVYVLACAWTWKDATKRHLLRLPHAKKYRKLGPLKLWREKHKYDWASIIFITMINHDVASYFLPQRKHGKKREQTCSTMGKKEKIFPLLLPTAGAPIGVRIKSQDI